MAASVVQTVDFSNVKEGGNFNRNRIPAGDYLATITKVEDAKSKKDDTFQYLFSIKIGKHPSRVFPFYCKLTENQLWKLRNLLIAAGINVPKKRMKVDPNKAVGRTIGVTIEDAEYDGKEQSEISAVFPAAELMDGNLVDDDEPETEEEETEEEDYSTEEEPEEDEAEEEEEEEAGDNLADLDRAALKSMLQSINGADWKAKKSQSDDDLRDLIRAAVPAEEEVEEDEEEEEEEAPAPVKKSKAKASKKSKKKAAEVSDDELEELDIDDL